MYKLKYWNTLPEKIPYVLLIQILKSAKESIVLRMNVAFRWLRHSMWNEPDTPFIYNFAQAVMGKKTITG